MAGTVLTLGVVHILLANVIYALPTHAVNLYTDAVAPAIAVSNDPTFAVSSNITLNAGSVRLAAGFIRAGADTIIILKRD